MYLESTSTSIISSKFTSNTANEAAVMFIINSYPVYIKSCVFKDNGGVSTLAGGVMVISSSSVVYSNDTSYTSNTVRALLFSSYCCH